MLKRTLCSNLPPFPYMEALVLVISWTSLEPRNFALLYSWERFEKI